MARDIDSHIHRIGRTCRAGSSDGIAYTLIAPKNAAFAGYLLQNLKAAKQTIPPELLPLAMTDRRFRESNSRGRGNTRGISHRGRGVSTNQSNSNNRNFSHGRGRGTPRGGIGFSTINFQRGTSQ